MTMKPISHRLVRVATWPEHSPCGIQTGTEAGKAVVWDTRFDRQQVNPKDLITISDVQKEPLAHACTACKAQAGAGCGGSPILMCFNSNRGQFAKMVKALNHDR